MKITSHTTLMVGKGDKAEYVDPGTPVELDDNEAAQLIKRGLAVKVAKTETPAPEKTDPAKNNGGNGQGAGNQGGNGQGAKQQ